MSDNSGRSHVFAYANSKDQPQLHKRTFSTSPSVRMTKPYKNLDSQKMKLVRFAVMPGTGQIEIIKGRYQYENTRGQDNKAHSTAIGGKSLFN